MSKTFNYNTTKIKNPSTGEWENMNSVTLKGKSAYEYAVEGGYEGTEEEFMNSLLNGQSKGFLPSMDLDDLFSPGIYGISGVKTYENLPTGMTYGTLEVFTPNAGNLDFVIQRLSNYRGTAYRFYANSKWYDWRNEFNELNSKIDDTGWVNCILGDSVKEVSGFTPQVRRIGKIVYLRGRVNNTTAWAEHDSIITIPSGFIPPKNMMFIQSSNGSYRYRLEIKTTGKCVANGITNDVGGNITNTVGSYYVLDCSWLLD